MDRMAGLKQLSTKRRFVVSRLARVERNTDGVRFATVDHTLATKTREGTGFILVAQSYVYEDRTRAIQWTSGVLTIKLAHQVLKGADFWAGNIDWKDHPCDANP